MARPGAGHRIVDPRRAGNGAAVEAPRFSRLSRTARDPAEKPEGSARCGGSIRRTHGPHPGLPRGTRRGRPHSDDTCRSFRLRLCRDQERADRPAQRATEKVTAVTPAIDVRDLRKTYPRRWASPAFEALKGVSLVVDEGEVFGFIGPNGAGKSTLIKVLTGVMRPTAGSASLFGIDVTHSAARGGLGYVPENPSLPDYLTPLEILGMGLTLHRREVADPRRHCTQWLERFSLGEVAGKVVRGFSKGMAQRTALAHALAVQPRLL
ncbi:MAG: ABC transporter ATP-binding protein, partial [Hyphomonadaceae bacterium]|nr:ABC transporter ATP-binding protein [Hyphomonadaceae bacterium]